VVPRLSEVRNQLADLLDDVFFPASVRPGLAETTRHYNFSLGTPLAQQPVIQAALSLLRLLTAYQLQQTDVSAMLLSPFWSASQQEADSRALLDAKMREKLLCSLCGRVCGVCTKQLEDGLNLQQLLADMNAAIVATPTRKAAASQWGQVLDTMLGALKWPGERNITSLEYQAINAWQKSSAATGQAGYFRQKPIRQ